MSSWQLPKSDSVAAGRPRPSTVDLLRHTRAMGSTINPCDFQATSTIERLNADFEDEDDEEEEKEEHGRDCHATAAKQKKSGGTTLHTSAIFKCLPVTATSWIGNFLKKCELKHQRYAEKRRIINDEINEIKNDRCELEYELRKRLSNVRLRNASFTVIHDLTAPPKEPEEDPAVKMQEFLKMAPDRVVISKFNYNITRRDLDSLLGLNWLNDEVINFYMSLLSERSKLREGLLPKAHTMNTFFLVRLLKSGYSGVRRWTRGVDIFQMDVIPVPVHVGNMHWCMAIIHLRDKYIRYYDSLGGPNQTALDALRGWLEAESLEKRKVPYDTSDFRLEHAAPNIPRQHNGSDCGVFSCMFAEYITRDAPITFSQSNMPHFRQKMYLEIATGKMRS